MRYAEHIRCNHVQWFQMRQAAIDPQGGEMTRRTILVVDDDPGIVTMVSAMLKRDVYVTITAHSGKEALRAYAQSKPDLILLDLAMPEMDGYEVVEAIRNQETEGDHTPIVLLTAHLQSYFAAINPDLKIDGYITKPVTAAKLRQDLKKLMPT